MKPRWFYALRPDLRAAAQLGALAARLAESLGGRALSAGDMHLTLVFVGERAGEDEAALAGVLAGLAPHWPAMALTRLGTFGRGLCWAGPAHPRGEAELDTAPGGWPAPLAAQVQQRLRAAGIAFDERTLNLHATLVRNARRDPRSELTAYAGALPIASARWTLSLGCSDAASSPQHRYRWRDAAGEEPGRRPGARAAWPHWAV